MSLEFSAVSQAFKLQTTYRLDILLNYLLFPFWVISLTQVFRRRVLQLRTCHFHRHLKKTLYIFLVLNQPKFVLVCHAHV